MNAIPVNRSNLALVDFDSIVVFFYAEPGAMGEAGKIEFSTADGKLYHLNYLHGDISLGEFRRACAAGSFETQTIPPFIWQYVPLGAGNHLLIHEIVCGKLMPEGADDPGQICASWQQSVGQPLLNKRERYLWLIDKARAAYPPEGSVAELTWCDACEDEINLWTYWQGRGNLAPEILLVGQDWGNPNPKHGEKMLSMEEIKAGPPYDTSRIFPTDRNLMEIFDQALHIKLNQRDKRLFFTNMLLGYRTGKASGGPDTPVDQDRAFFKELVNILRPRIVICLGQTAFDAALDAYGQPHPYTGSFRQALDEKRNTFNIEEIHFFGMGHCGRLGCLNRAGNRKGAGEEAGLQIQIKDWQRIKEYLQI